MTSCRGLAPLIALAACAAALTGCAGSNEGAGARAATPAGGATCSYASSSEQAARTVDPPSPQNIANQGTTSATLTLDGKPVVLTLDRAKAPCTTNSFVSLAQQEWFTNTTCHRLVDRGIFVLQCGDPTGTGRGGPGYVFNDELETAKTFQPADRPGTVTYPKGTLAMANAGPGTNGSQFFIVWQASPLPPAYTAFGRVDQAGMEAVQNIAAQGVAADRTRPNAPAKISAVALG